jgi:hypothetical protein
MIDLLGPTSCAVASFAAEVTAPPPFYMLHATDSFLLTKVIVW